MILAPLLKLPKNVGYLGKFIGAKGFKKLPKEQKIANSGHTSHRYQCPFTYGSKPFRFHFLFSDLLCFHLISFLFVLSASSLFTARDQFTAPSNLPLDDNCINGKISHIALSTKRF